VPKLQPLPTHIKREYVRTPRGDLEILVCGPKTSNATTETPITFFVHGGFGNAGVWIEWMTQLYNKNHPGWLVAYSGRGHGASYALSYFDMVFKTTIDDFVEDLVAAEKYARDRVPSTSFRQEMIFAGHSSGGGLVQYALSKAAIRAQAICLVDAMPHFGMLDAYWNWFKHDPLFPLRICLHLGHPVSPLSSLRLVQLAFFGPKIGASRVAEFMRWMAPYESLSWPISQSGSFWLWLLGRNEWLNVDDIIGSLKTSEKANSEQVLILVGDEDMMFHEMMYRRQATEYRHGFEKLVRMKRVDESSDPLTTEPEHSDLLKISESGSGVALKVVLHAGHHLQNDVQSAVGAEIIRNFITQV
jgi:pimeloyl-ACP methyl ester carboxylesterase